MHTRASAYALAVHNGHILLTQLASYCTNAGHWTLPGGGIDHGEQPEQTVHREALEETGLPARDLQLFHVRTFSEDTSRGAFLAVQIVYRATIEGAPSVQEEGGSTAAVAWVPLSQVAALPTVSLVDSVLALLDA